MLGGPELIILLFWLVPVAFVYLMVRKPSDRSVAAFAKIYAVPLTAGNVEQLRRYISWTRRWRVGGAVALSLVAGAFTAIRNDTTSSFWLPLVIGYGLGSVIGEIVRPTERLEHHASASLQRRQVRDFIRPGYLIALAIFYVAGLFPAIWLLVTNPQRNWAVAGHTEPPGERPQDWFVLALIGVSTGAVLLCAVGGRALARAPFPADTPDRQAVRHAIRSAAVLSLVGATAMINGVVASKLAWPVYVLAMSPTVGGIVTAINICGLLVSTWGALLTLTSIPRIAPFAGRLPLVPPAEGHAGA